MKNLVLAETKDRWDWEMLAPVENKIGDFELKSIISRAVREAGQSVKYANRKHRV